MTNQPYSGGPDYGAQQRAITAPSTDFADIATLINGYALSDGLGKIITHDDFRNGLARWSLAKVGTGVNPALSTQQGRVFAPPNAVKLDATAALNDASIMSYSYYTNRVQRLGIETMLSLEANTARITIDLQWLDSTATKHVAQLVYEPTDNSFKVSASGTPVTVLTVDDADFLTGVYIPVKMVVDFQTDRYIRLIVGNNAYDISQHSFTTVAGSSNNNLRIQILATNVNAATGFKAAYLGYVTITYDEP